jgi:hypothetical protein
MTTKNKTNIEKNKSQIKHTLHFTFIFQSIYITKIKHITYISYRIKNKHKTSKQIKHKYILKKRNKHKQLPSLLLFLHFILILYL